MKFLCLSDLWHLILSKKNFLKVQIMSTTTSMNIGGQIKCYRMYNTCSNLNSKGGMSTNISIVLIKASEQE